MSFFGEEEKLVILLGFLIGMSLGYLYALLMIHMQTKRSRHGKAEAMVLIKK
ncbi:MAG: hypothetical protein KY468_03385 [Armatimonadetes bacterium]|nr:hypothetical protein [Armatimonadota bacterium]